MLLLSDDKTRAVEDTFGGYACYRGETVGSQFSGHHVGLVTSEAEVNEFLASNVAPKHTVTFDIEAAKANVKVDK